MRSVALLAAASVALILLLAAPTAAHAEPEPVPRALTADAPAITSPAPGAFVGSASAVISGTKAAGAEIQILAGAARAHVCTVDGDTTNFSCNVRLPSGPSVRLVAVQLLDGSPNVESAPVDVDVLAEPAVSGPSPQLTSGLVQGDGYPGATITLSTGGGAAWSFPAGPDGSWAYVLPRTLGSGTFTLTATQSAAFRPDSSSMPGASRTVILDVDAPPAPRVTSPAGGGTIGTAGTSFSGRGEDRSTVDVFAVTGSGSDVTLCSALVSDGGWTCIGQPLPAGTVTVTAFQKDAAGNVGGGSLPLFLRVEAPSSPAPSPGPPAPTDGGAQPGQAPVAPAVPASPAPGPTGPVPLDSAPDEAPRANDPVTATPFTRGVPSALAAADLSWLRALVLAAVAIMLLLVPARMLATGVGSRRLAGVPLSLTGRNRVPTHDDPAPLVASPGVLVTAGLLVVVAGGMVLFANPVHGQPEYLRVFLASVTALAVLNAVSTWLPRFLTPGLARIEAAPRFLLTVGAVALLSRLLELQPALLFGVVFTVTAASAASSARGILALMRIGAVFTAGVLAWLLSTLLGTPAGFAETFVVEVANIAAVAGIGSAAILLVPVGRMDGRALLAWSRPAWFAAAAVVLTVLFALLAPVVDVWQNSGNPLLLLVAVLGFASVGFSVWLWRRVIRPALSSD